MEYEKLLSEMADSIKDIKVCALPATITVDNDRLLLARAMLDVVLKYYEFKLLEKGVVSDKSSRVQDKNGCTEFPCMQTNCKICYPEHDSGSSEAQKQVCIYCGGLVALRNPTGICDHLMYPENVNKILQRKTTEIRLHKKEIEILEKLLSQTNSKLLSYQNGKSTILLDSVCVIHITTILSNAKLGWNCMLNRAIDDVIKLVKLHEKEI